MDHGVQFTLAVRVDRQSRSQGFLGRPVSPCTRPNTEWEDVRARQVVDRIAMLASEVRDGHAGDASPSPEGPCTCATLARHGGTDVVLPLDSPNGTIGGGAPRSCSSTYGLHSDCAVHWHGQEWQGCRAALV